jgi:Transaldolase/Fructose-6-phosphate aldolase
VNRLQRLQDAGVSIWLDTLSRELLETGAFSALVDDFAVTGATSNPTIFAKAITGSDRYDEQLRTLASGAADDLQELFFAVALDDVRSAAQVLLPVHQRTRGQDGYVSFECTPDVADDAEATIDQALELWRRLDLPNVLIKVPATQAGVSAIETLTARGVNVNVTLLFSVERYEDVIEAYLRGLERRVAAGEPVDGFRRSPRSSSRGSMPRPTRSSRRSRRCADRWQSPTPTALTGTIWRASATSAGAACNSTARHRSAPSGRAREPRTPATPTSSTSSA